MTTDTQPVYDISTAPVTGYGGTLKIDNLPCGDYCLEEVQSPEGYSHMGNPKAILIWEIRRNFPAHKNNTEATSQGGAYHI